MIYNNLFTWGSVVKSNVGEFIEHTDGTLSCAIQWDGLEIDTCVNDSESAAMYDRYYQYLSCLSQYKGICIEHHGFRNRDNALAIKYYEYGKSNMVRSKTLGMKIREDIANKLSEFSYDNSTYIVITLDPENSFFNSATKSHRKRNKRIEVLSEIVNRIESYLDGFSLLSGDDFRKLIIRSTMPDYYLNSTELPSDRFFIRQNHVIKPVYEDGLVKTGSCFTKVILIVDYPDAKPEWYKSIASLFNVSVHVTQILKPLNSDTETFKSARKSERGEEAARAIGGEASQGMLSDQSDYRRYIQDNNLSTFSNTYIIKISSHDKNTLLDAYDCLEKNFLIRNGAVVETGREDVDLLYWRISAPATGYKSPFKRSDHHWQIGNMSPIITFNSGSTSNIQSLGITSNGSLVGFEYIPNGVHHKLVAAKTGSGKSVAIGAQICELYPLGYDFLIVEVGRSFEWVVRLFGGDYHVLDANTAVISPLPSYSYAEQYMNDDCLEADIIGPTIVCLLPILLGRSDYENIEGIGHYKSALEDLVNAIYIVNEGCSGSPSLKTLLDIGKEIHVDLDSLEKINCAKEMLSSLDSFLSRAEGKVFLNSDSIDFDKPMIGIDFSRLLDGSNNDLAKYLLMFIGVRFKQISFSRKNQVFSVWDEFHEPVDLDRHLMYLLQKQSLKRGRKAGSFFNPISQEVMDMIADENGVPYSGLANQYTHLDLMYYGTDFGKLKEFLKIPDRPMKSWESFKDPVAGKYSYRQCMKKHGSKWYDIEYRFPQIISDVTNSNPDALQLKSDISIANPVNDEMNELEISDNSLLNLKLFREFYYPSDETRLKIEGISKKYNLSGSALISKYMDVEL